MVLAERGPSLDPANLGNPYSKTPRIEVFTLNSKSPSRWRRKVTFFLLSILLHQLIVKNIPIAELYKSTFPDGVTVIDWKIYNMWKEKVRHQKENIIYAKKKENIVYLICIDYESL